MRGNTYTATVSWRSDSEDFARGRYSRGHVWRFDGGTEVPATASPHVVPERFTVAGGGRSGGGAGRLAVLVPHADLPRYRPSRRLRRRRAMRTMPSARWRRTTPASYWVAEVTLSPRIAFAGKAPEPDELARLHDAAHADCFIANSLLTRVTVA